MRFQATRRAVQLLIVLTGVACAGPASAPAGGPASGAAPPAPQRKAIVIALQAEVNALTGGMNQTGILNPPSRYFHEFVNAYLTYRDQNDDVRPWIAADLPSVAAGTWRVLDDGRMEMTWKLRQGVKWHDGQELTSADVKFSWEAARDRSEERRVGKECRL